MTTISRIFSSAMIALGLYVILTARTFPEGTGGVLGPGFFPILLGILLIGLSALQLFNTRKEKAVATAFLTESTKRVLFACLIIIGYMAAIAILGFLISTPLFLFGIMWFFSVRKWSTLLISSIATTAVLYFVFLKFLSVSLPAGILF
nr:tripartite tricarboxylate transporter TctB family protein [uncultured Sphaerochaeta sp.]